MKKLWLGLGLLAMLLILGLGELGMLAERSRRAGEALTRAYEAAEAGDMALALDRALRVRRYWESATPAVDAVTSHEETDEIRRSLAELPALAENGQSADFLALCGRLRVMIAHLAEMERPRWYNILSAAGHFGKGGEPSLSREPVPAWRYSPFLV